MKRFTILLLAFAMLFGISSYLRAEDSANDFTLVNKTGYVISHVYVAPSKSDDWGDDIMGKDVLNDGESVDIKFHPKATTSEYDIKVIYKIDGSSAVWSGYDLTKITKITIHWDDKKQVTTAEVEKAQ